ncbi:metal-sulfur cluster assembly factor [Mumia sp. DW29H23]|uniref:metal-sulfur cluster assembly factor n=1 Tax=Mumia sp. DW29H23 TaxID=3421241 RepID=UPI003D69C548
MAETVDTTIRDALRAVYDPCCREKGISVVDMGLLHRAEVEDGVARVELLLTSGWCPFATTVLSEAESAVRALPGVTDASVEVVWSQAWTPERLSAGARERLRFLPDPAAVGDPAAYVRDKTPAGGS